MTRRPLLPVERLICGHAAARAALPDRHSGASCVPRAAASAALGAMLATCLAFAVLGVLGSTASLADSGAAAGHWPRVAWPKEITPIAIGHDLEINGLPLQVQAFVSAAQPGEVARWFHRSLGPSLLETRLDRQLVLGRMQGSHYLTVQLEAAGGGTRGLIGLTDLQAGARAHSNYRHDAERALAPWPAGSHLASSVSSLDAARRSHHTVVVNGHTEALNAAHLQAMLAERGFALERATVPGTVLGQGADDEPPEAPGRVLFFKGPGGEALATIHRDGRGRSVVVLNTVGQAERLR